MDLFQIVLITASVLLTVVTLLWIFSLLLRDASIIDIFWGPGFSVIVWLETLLSGPGTALQIGISILVTIWSMRLGIHLFLRNRGKGEDPRYKAMRSRHETGFWWKSLFIVFHLQALIMLVVSIPLQAAILNPHGDVSIPLIIVGLAVWIAGFLFETISDRQKMRFKADPKNRNRVLDEGLWRYSRHPNYFGDFLVWWGFYALSLAVDLNNWWTLLGPILMSYLLISVSGVKLLERSLKDSKPGYMDYLKKTSAFIPLPPRE